MDDQFETISVKAFYERARYLEANYQAHFADNDEHWQKYLEMDTEHNELFSY
eukprot:SAG22_NODE_2015_length_3137_cov_7.334101_4_plen_52_part_00